MKRQEVIETIANEIIGYQEEIKATSDYLNNEHKGYSQAIPNMSIMEDQRAIKVLKRLSRKLGLWEAVEEEVNA